MKWDSLLLRIRAEAKGKLKSSPKGVAIVTAHIVVSNDKALSWAIKSIRVEPSNNAAELINGLLGELGD